MAKEDLSFWERLIKPPHHYKAERERMVLEYIIHRVGDGAHLRDVMEEEYVRRYLHPDEVEDILQNPKLVESARKKMEEYFSSNQVGPR
ncbi:MAG: hypothetical protein M3305_07950 [Actinomycetota bacterium]|nr:hypothetical protein [Actinomycetota bacterium]